MNPSDETVMALCLEEARRSLDHDDVPVGAIVTFGGDIVARRHNEREKLHDPTAHAEILALRDASERLGSWRLLEATLYVTLEPCPMCAGATVAARLGRLVFGAHDPKAGATGSLYDLCNDRRLNHQVTVTSGILAPECGEVLREFFQKRRRPPTEA